MELLDLHDYRSDPILEPMLQSVPDPFDSYGPPQAEDQIFSILAPLSIMTHAHTSSHSPVTGTSTESATSHDKITSWLPKASNGDTLPSEATEWAGSPVSTPPRSVSPPASSRRLSTPSTSPRKADTKVRRALSVIDECHPQYSSEDTSGSTSGETLQLDTGQQPNWSFIYGQSPYEHTGDDPSTPRHSSLFLPQSPSLPDPKTGPPDGFREPNEPNKPAPPAFAPAIL